MVNVEVIWNWNLFETDRVHHGRLSTAIHAEKTVAPRAGVDVKEGYCDSRDGVEGADSPAPGKLQLSVFQQHGTLESDGVHRDLEEKIIESGTTRDSSSTVLTRFLSFALLHESSCVGCSWSHLEIAGTRVRIQNSGAGPGRDGSLDHCLTFFFRHFVFRSD